MNVSFVEYANIANPMIAGIVQVITNNSIFLKNLRFVQKDGFTHEYAVQKTTGSIAFRGINESFTADTGVINPAVEQLKIFGGTIRTDRQLAKGPKGNNVRANNIAQKVRRAALTFDLTVIDGNSATEPRDFDGLNRRLTGKQVIKMDTNGAPLDLETLDLALDQTVGGDDQKFIVCSKAVRRQIKDLVIDAAGGAAVADVNAPIPSYRGASIQVIDEDGDQNPILSYDEACGSSNVATSLYVCNGSGDGDTDNMKGLVREVDGQMIEQIAYGERSGFFEDLVESVMGLALHHPRCATRLMGILDPG